MTTPRPSLPPTQPSGPTHPSPSGPGRTAVLPRLMYPGDPTGSPPEPAPRPGTPVPPARWHAARAIGFGLMVASVIALAGLGLIGR